ncbi:hypothetical protein H920_20091 [Fukomys damarensis]|uniref:Uncharacterized protein n=1 Tax=Fukomys damarensis TaxID=885580 RepID=A0A091CL76_FUKDA|nr:hypothetical protein H920_20091 [Fukomys damarensis]
MLVPPETIASQEPRCWGAGTERSPGDDGLLARQRMERKPEWGSDNGEAAAEGGDDSREANSSSESVYNGRLSSSGDHDPQQDIFDSRHLFKPPLHVSAKEPEVSVIASALLAPEVPYREISSMLYAKQHLILPEAWKWSRVGDAVLGSHVVQAGFICLQSRA